MRRAKPTNRPWISPQEAQRQVERLNRSYHDPNRHGPIDYFLRFIDALRAEHARRIIYQGLHATTAHPDHLNALTQCDAVRIGLAAHEPAIRRRAAELACRAPSAQHGELLARAMQDKRVTIPSWSVLIELVDASLMQSEHAASARGMISTLARNASREVRADRLIALLGGVGEIEPVRKTLRGLPRDKLEEARRILSRSRGTPSVLAAIRLAGMRSFAEAAGRRLADATSEHEGHVLLGLAHLALIPSRAAAMRQVPALATRWTGQGSPRSQRLGAIRLVRARVGEPMTRRRQSTSTLADPDPLIRRTLLDAASPAVLADMCFDRDPAIARGAAWRRSEAGRPWSLEISGSTRALLQHAKRSPNAPVRAAASADQARIGELVTPIIPDAPRSLALRARMQTEPAETLASLRAVLLGEQADDAIGAMRLARRAGVHSLVADELIELVRRHAALTEPESCRLTATSVATLTGVDLPRARTAIGIGLRHPDPRVRANAVEATWAGRGRVDQRLVDLQSDAHHRVRANVLRAMASSGGSHEGGAGEGLASMLSERSRLPRLAGLWAIERAAVEPKPLGGAPWADVAKRVAVLAQPGEDERVRARAVRTARRLVTSIHSAPVAA